jgi:hypothetical protein
MFLQIPKYQGINFLNRTFYFIMSKYSSILSSELDKLKTEYIRIYSAIHSQARLGRNEDDRKTALTNDNRLITAESLSYISLIPDKELKNLGKLLVVLKPAIAFLRRIS